MNHLALNRAVRIALQKEDLRNASKVRRVGVGSSAQEEGLSQAQVPMFKPRHRHAPVISGQSWARAAVSQIPHSTCGSGTNPWEFIFFSQISENFRSSIESKPVSTMGKASKSTKKFQKNHLKRTVDQRKTEQSYKSKFLNLKKKKGNQDGYTTNDDLTKTRSENEVFENGSAENFFNANTDNLAIGELKKSKSKNAPAQPSLDDSAESDPELLEYLKGDQDGQVQDTPMLLSTEKEQGESDEEDAYEEEDLRDISVEVIANWKKSLESQQSAKTIQKISTTFKDATKSTELMDEKAFSNLLDLVLKTMPAALQHSVPISLAKNGTRYVDTNNKKFKGIAPSLKNYATGLSRLLGQKQNAALALQVSGTLIPYFLSFKKQTKTLIDTITRLAFSDDLEVSATAFDVLENIAEGQSTLLDTVLQAFYNQFMKSSLESSPTALSLLTLQKERAAVLFKINPQHSFDTGFQLIRRLALHLRSIITNKDPQAYKTIYNWQFVQSLDFWMKIIGSQCDKTVESMEGRPSVLRELIYPLVQVILGTIRLIPSPQYFPLRFFLLRGLISLALSTGVYIPVLPILTEVLSSSVITKTPKYFESLPPLDFSCSIRASKVYLGTKVYQDCVGDEFVELAGEVFYQHCKSIAFPELAVPAVIKFKNFIKRNGNGKFTTQLQKLVERLEANSKFIQQKRNNVNISPTNKAEVAVFLKDLPLKKTPLGSYVEIQRQTKAQRSKSEK